MRYFKIFSFVSFVLLLMVWDLSLTSCAARSAPDGGPKDTLAPVLDTSFPPNKTLRFSQKKVILVFNEYIDLKDPANQITFSPPLRNKPKIINSGKELEISWTDTLLENTTYIISFGSAVVDFTEGNVNDNLKYVFSTGDFIDSLSLKGQVLDITTGEPVKDILVALYNYENIKEADSIPFQNIPIYYDYTSEKGVFELSYMKYGDYHVVAFEDTRKNFRMNTGMERTAFLNDTLTLKLRNEPIELYAFTPEAKQRFYGAKQVAQGKIIIPFNYPVDGLTVEAMDSPEVQGKKAFEYLTFNKQKDTATYWFETLDRDSLVLHVKYRNLVNDTATVYLKKYDEKPLRFSPLDKELKVDDTLFFKANSPLAELDTSRIFGYTSTDTFTLVNARISDPLEFGLLPSKRPAEYRVEFKTGAATGMFAGASDSAEYIFKTLRKDDLGNLVFTVTTDTTSPLVLNVYNPDGKRILHRSFKGNTRVNFKQMKPGVYNVELVVDEDSNGKWSTGNYLQRKQPERIIIYKETMEIRANWDLELEWKPDISKPAAKMDFITPIDNLNAPQDSLK